MMKHINKILVLLSSLVICVVHLNAQNYRKITFDKHLEQTTKSATEIYPVLPGYPTTAIILSIDHTDNFDGAFVIVNKDTTYLHPDEDSEPDDIKVFSNLVTFSSPIDSFYFCPGKIKGEVTFYLINATAPKQAPSSSFLKKKVPAVPGQIWWISQYGELVCQRPITTGSIRRYLI